MSVQHQYKLLLTTEVVNRLTKGPVGKRKLLSELLRDITAGSWEKWQSTVRGFSSWVAEETGTTVYGFLIPEFGVLVWERKWSIDLPSVVESPVLEQWEDLRGPSLYAPFAIVRGITVEEPSTQFEFQGRLYKNSSSVSQDAFWERKHVDEVEYNEELFHLPVGMIDDFISGVQSGLALHLSEAQAKILRPRNGPILLSGQAGSGKTSVVISWLLINHVKHFDQIPPPREPLSQLFVTFSDRLRELAESEFTITLPRKSSFHKTRFQTYRGLLLDILTVAGQVEEYPATKEMTFERFMHEYAPTLPKGAIDPVLLWDEIRSVIKGGAVYNGRLMTFDQYDRLSDARGYCKVPKHLRALYHQRAKDYEDLLRDNDYWDGIDLARACLESLPKGALGQPNQFGMYDKIACDEVQDMAMVEIFLLLRLLRRTDFSDLFLTGDTAQVINPSGFLWERLKNTIFIESNQQLKPAVDYLDKNYRSCLEIVQLVKGVLDVRRELLDDEISKEGMTSVLPTNVKPVIVHASPLDIIKSTQTSPGRRLVLTKTREEKETLEKLLGVSKDHVTILTIEEAKGLEYEGALLWKFFMPRHEAITKDEWKRVFVPEKRRRLKVEIKKGEVAPYGLTYEFNLLHVGLTRARKLLAFFDENPEMRLENLDKGWIDPDSGLLAEMDQKEFSKLWDTVPVTAEELFELGKKLMGRDTPQAKRMFRLAAETYERDGDMDGAAKSYAEAKDCLRSAQCYAANSDRANQLRMLALNEEQNERWKDAGMRWDELGDFLIKEGKSRGAANAYRKASVNYGLAKELERAALSLSNEAKALSTVSKADSAKAFQECANKWLESKGSGTLQNAIQARHDAIFEARGVENDEDLVASGNSKEEWIAKRFMEIYSHEDSLNRPREAALAAGNARNLWKNLIESPKYARRKEEYEAEYRASFARLIESHIKSGETQTALSEQVSLLLTYKGDTEAAVDQWRNTFCALYLRNGEIDALKETTIQLSDYLVVQGKHAKALGQIDITIAVGLPHQILLEMLQKRALVAEAKADYNELGKTHAELARQYGGPKNTIESFRSLHSAAVAYQLGGMPKEASEFFERAFGLFGREQILDPDGSGKFNTAGKYSYKVAGLFVERRMLGDALRWGIRAADNLTQTYDESTLWLEGEWRIQDGLTWEYAKAWADQKNGMTLEKVNSMRRPRGVTEFILARTHWQREESFKDTRVGDVRTWSERAAKSFEESGDGPAYSAALSELGVRWK